MLNTEKIRLMTKLSLYEKKNESKALKAGKYYRSDFISLGLLNSAIVATLAFFIVLSLVIFVNIEELLSVITTLDFMEVGKVLVSSYLIYLLSYLMIVYVVYRLKYERMTKEIKEYDGTLKELYMIYKKEDNSSHEVVEQINEDEEVADEANLDEETEYENDDSENYKEYDEEYDEEYEEYEEEYDGDYEEEYDDDYEDDYREIDEDELESTLDDKYGKNMYLEEESNVTGDTVTLIDLNEEYEEEYEHTDSEDDSMNDEIDISILEEE